MNDSAMASASDGARRDGSSGRKGAGRLKGKRAPSTRKHASSLGGGPADRRGIADRLSGVAGRLAMALEWAHRLEAQRPHRRQTSVSQEEEYAHLLQLVVELSLAQDELTDAQIEVGNQRELLIDTARQLEQERIRYRDLFSLAPDAYFVTTNDGAIVEANEAAGQILNIGESFVVGQLLGIFLTGRNGRPIVAGEMLKLRAADGGRRESLGCVRQRGGNTIDVSISLTPIRDPEWRSVIGGRWILRDVTAWVTTENEIRDLNRELEVRVTTRTEELERRSRELAERTREAESANRAKANFLATMSHEIRTPLNAVAGYVELLDIGVHGALNDQQRDYLRRIRAANAHLLALLNDVLNFARLESARIQYRHDSLMLVPLLASAESMIETQARRKGVRLRRESADGSLVGIADAEKVLQIVLNLLTNAVKFTEAGGDVVITAGKDSDKTVWIEVRDTGRGIPVEQQEAVFEPFVQIGRASPGLGEGVGLGLAISRDLARGMSGDLTLVSAPGKGSTFRLTLPRANHDGALAHKA